MENKRNNLKKIQQIKISRGGGTIFSFDYSTLEVRVLSAISGDLTLKNVLLSGADLHCNTARNIFPELKNKNDREIKEHFSTLRSKSKSALFGLLYGQTAFNFAKEWNCTIEEAQKIVDNLLGAYPGIQEYIKKQHDFARKNGYIIDAFGCKRPLPEAQLPEKKGNKKILKHAMNVAQNSNIQSSSSRMAWIAGSHIAEEMIKQDLWSVMLGGVHDSTYLDIYPGEFVPVFKICLFHAAEVPNYIYDWMNGNKIIADFSWGQSWGRELDIKSFKEDEDKFYLTLQGGNIDWEYLKKELDLGYEYKILNIKDIGNISREEQENLPIEMSSKEFVIDLEFPNRFSNMRFKSKYYVGNNCFGKRDLND